MKLNVFELGLTGAFGNTQLAQDFTVGEDSLDVSFVRLHLYRKLLPAGSMIVEIQDANGKKISGVTTAINTAEFNTGNYYHGYVRFYVPCQLKANTTYKLVLRSTGYTYSGAAYIGWCNGFDLKKVSSTITPTPVGVQAALDFELWVYRKLSRGTF